MEDDNGRNQAEIEAYLAMIRKTIADSERLVSQAELRIAETDRMLEQQGLTRDQVLSMRFSGAQLAAANEELARRGLAPIDADEEGSGWGANREAVDAPLAQGVGLPDSAADDPDRRREKFGMMMKPFRI
jgi:cell division septum initiation protein DivIVA